MVHQIVSTSLPRDSLSRHLITCKQEDENRRIADLRRTSIEEGGLLFKAKPVNDGVPSDASSLAPPPPMPLTEPKSPHLATAQRAALRQSVASSLSDLSSKIDGMGGSARQSQVHVRKSTSPSRSRAHSNASSRTINANAAQTLTTSGPAAGAGAVALDAGHVILHLTLDAASSSTSSMDSGNSGGSSPSVVG